MTMHSLSVTAALMACSWGALPTAMKYTGSYGARAVRPAATAPVGHNWRRCRLFTVSSSGGVYD